MHENKIKKILGDALDEKIKQYEKYSLSIPEL